MKAILSSERYSPHEVARLLNVHSATVWRWFLRGVRGRRLRAVLIGGRRYVLAEDLDAFLAAGNSERQVENPDLARRAADAGRILDGLGVRLPPAPASPPADVRPDQRQARP